jgi:hypothetical protein
VGDLPTLSTLGPADIQFAAPALFSLCPTGSAADGGGMVPGAFNMQHHPSAPSPAAAGGHHLMSYPRAAQDPRAAEHHALLAQQNQLLQQLQQAAAAAAGIAASSPMTMEPQAAVRPETAPGYSSGFRQQAVSTGVIAAGLQHASE